MGIKTIPLGLEEKVKILGNASLNKLLGENQAGDLGKLIAIYFGHTLSGTHKEILARQIVAHALSIGQNIIPVISSGSLSTALYIESLKYPDVQIVEMVGWNKLPKSARANNYDITRVVDDETAPLRIRIGFDPTEYFDKEGIEQLVYDTIQRKDNKQLKDALRRRGIIPDGLLGLFAKPKVMDGTNLDYGPDNPIYQFDPDFLGGFDIVATPVGTGQIASGLQYAVNQLPPELRPRMLFVTSPKHPIARKEDDKNIFEDGEASKLITPYICSTSEHILNNWVDGKDAIFLPNGTQIRAAYGLIEIARRDKERAFYELGVDKIVKTKWFGDPKFIRTNFRGEEEIDRSYISPRSCTTGSVALSILENPRTKDGILLPVHPNPQNSEYEELFIGKGAKVLVILTGESKSKEELKDLAELYFSEEIEIRKAA